MPTYSLASKLLGKQDQQERMLIVLTTAKVQLYNNS